MSDSGMKPMVNARAPGWRCRAAIPALAGALLVLAGAALPLPGMAADEDTQASVYLVFDPETGEFATVHDAQGQAKAQETQEAIDSVADVGAGAAAPDAAGAGASTTNPALIAGLVVAGVLIVGGTAWIRRRA